MNNTKLQFLKFVCIGIANTIIDFGVLNICIALFGLGTGDVRYIPFKAISFIVAATNSFIFNKIWVFRKKQFNSNELKKEIPGFLSVSIAGLILNTLIASLVFKVGHTISPQVSIKIWANVGALIGSICVLIFNFFGYKFFVFKSKTQHS